jgi:uncharacterized protein (TIGR02452 family)
MNNRNIRAELAQETVRIAQAGTYQISGTAVNIADAIAHTNKNSLLILQTQAEQLERDFTPKTGDTAVELRSESTLSAILRLGRQSKKVGVLNFASAKNPGGGFLNGALAQEESLAASSALYLSQLECPVYYETNRACRSMMYTDCAIWSPDTVFFRDDRGALLNTPVTASVLTLPAVNYGQVLTHGENTVTAKATMKRRMKIALAIFADQDCDTLILGAYGCGVFRNDPGDVAKWWSELLTEYGGHYKTVIFSILDHSPKLDVFTAFERMIPATKRPPK